MIDITYNWSNRNKYFIKLNELVSSEDLRNLFFKSAVDEWVTTGMMAIRSLLSCINRCISWC